MVIFQKDNNDIFSVNKNDKFHSQKLNITMLVSKVVAEEYFCVT
jgi:hypothetical protein